MLSVQRLNAWFDGLPRSSLRVGGGLVPSYLALGLGGAAAATLTLLLLTVLAGRSLLVSLSLVPLAAATFVVLGLLRRAVTGAEETVLLEHLFAVLATTFAATRLAALPPWPYLDLVATALAVFMVFGRVGCLLAGCCHGLPAGLGVRYPRECGHPTAIRRLPLPLIEALVWAALAAAGGGLILTGRPSADATATVLAGYGAARLCLEPLRGDRRPTILGLEEGHWLAGAALAAGVALHDPRPPAPVLALAALAALLSVALVATRRRWLHLEMELDPERRAALVELGRRLASGPVGAEVTMSRLGPLSVGASLRPAPGGAILTLSLASLEPLGGAEAGLWLEALLEGLGVSRLECHPIRRDELFVAELLLPAAG